MKTLWSKHAVIALLTTNLATVGFIAKDKFFKHRHLRSHQSTQGEAASQRHGIVEPVYFKNSDDLQACYESFLQRGPTRDEGSVLVNMKITSEGQIDSLKLVQNDFDEPVFTQCILDKIKATRLPASEDKAGFVIAHRFKFHRKTAEHLNFDSE